MKAQIDCEKQSVLINEYRRFDGIVTNSLTAAWWHDSEAPKMFSYFTSSFLHGDWQHLLFNLIFFFAFSIAAEQILGSLFYLGFVALCCTTIGYAYEYGAFRFSGSLPTIGLSGVVSGIMAFVALIYPT